MKTITYKTQGTCSRFIEVTGDNGVIVDVKFYGGCDGNLKAISILIEGMNANDVIRMLEGNTCGFKKTSCPDQLAIALRLGLEEQAKNA